MKINDVIRHLEALAPPVFQEGYDNAGLLIGDAGATLKGVLVCLDCTEAVIAEAAAKKCNLVVAHHPVVFSGLKRFTGRTYVERVVVEAIRRKIAVYAIHTNLDNVSHGVNAQICGKLGLKDCRVLRPLAGTLQKLVVFCPEAHAEAVRAALFEHGAGHLGAYDECSFNSAGTGTFRAGADANPFVGKKGGRHEEPEVRIEVILEAARSRAVVDALARAHPYEEPAWDLYPLANENRLLGAGMVGTWPQALDEAKALRKVKAAFRAGVVRHTALRGLPVKTVAVCGGSGSFLVDDAVRRGADLFVSADFKYHQFFDADGRILVADIGHFESEQFTIELLGDFLKDKMPTFALHLTETITNPVHYL